MTRGDLIMAMLTRDHGKPRPCLVVQSDRLAKLDGVLLCPLTSDIETDGPTRVRVEPDAGNNLVTTSLVMVDKVIALSRSRYRSQIGHLDQAAVGRVNTVLFFVLGLLD